MNARLPLPPAAASPVLGAAVQPLAAAATGGASIQPAAAVAAAAAAPAAARAPVLLQIATVWVDADGSYSIYKAGAGASQGAQWLASVSPRLRNGSAWLPPMTATPTTPAATAGSDALGDFQSVAFAWAANGISSGWVTSVRAYARGDVVFAQNFTKAVATDGRLGVDTPLSWWPAFSTGGAVGGTTPAPALGYLGFSGCMSGHAESGTFGKPAARAGATAAAPLASSSSNLKISGCKPGTKAQEWEFIEEGMVKNDGLQECLQLGHCATTKDAEVAVNVACKKASMCGGANLGWKYFHSNSSLMSTLSWMCLTSTNGKISQAPCTRASSQVFYYDNATRHIGPLSSPDPVPTSCLEASDGGATPHPHGPPKSSSAAWGGEQAGPLALFDESNHVKILSPLTEHMSAVMNHHLGESMNAGFSQSLLNSFLVSSYVYKVLD